MTAPAEKGISTVDIEQILTGRLDRYSVDDIDRAVVGAQIDPAVAIKVAPIPDGEEVIDGILIRDSAAVVDEEVRVNSHIHNGGDDQATKTTRGLEVYKVLEGEGIMSLGDPVLQDGDYLRDAAGNIKINYTDHIIVKPGSFVTVKPGQAHSLFNTSKNKKLKFVFNGSPDHIEPKPIATDRIMATNPDEAVVRKEARPASPKL